MEPSLCAGRKVQQQILSSLIGAALGKSAPQDGTAAVPRLLLFHGSNGLGKTTLVHLCMESVSEFSKASGMDATALLLDLDSWRFRNGRPPATVREFADALYAVAAAQGERTAFALAPCAALNRKIAEFKGSRRSPMKIEWLKRTLLDNKQESRPGPSFPNETPDKTVDFNSWIAQSLAPSDSALLQNPDELLAETLAECLADLSRKLPFILCIDSLELAADTEIVGWLIRRLLPRLFAPGNSVAVVLAGSHSFVRGCKNEFSDESVYPVSLAELTLPQSAIASVAAGRSMTLPPEQIGIIEQRTAGIPLVVQAALDAAAANIPLDAVLQRKRNGAPAEVSEASALVNECVDSLFTNSNDSREMLTARIFHLAMLYRYDENILAGLWNVPAGDIAARIAELGHSTSFVRNEQLHSAVRDRVRATLVSEAAAGAAGPLANFFKHFSSTCVALYAQYLTHFETEMPDGFERYADPGWQMTLAGSLNAFLWAQENEAMRRLPGLLVEALHYNRNFAIHLLGFADGCEKLLSENSLALIKALKSCCARVPPSDQRSGAGKQVEKDLFDLLINFEGDMTKTQQGLLGLMLGELACRAGYFEKAQEAFEKSSSFFDPGVPEQALLFENFLWTGLAFLRSGKTNKAAAALAHAAQIRADDGFVWEKLGGAHQALGNHGEAVAALVEAVKINHNAVDAWIELGNEYTALNDHAHAAESFSRVTEIDGQRPVAWYKLGCSLEILGRFAEAEAAFKKTVAIIPDHWEALFAVGRTQSTQGKSTEAIVSLNQTVALKPDCTAAWKTLGTELFGAGEFQKSAVALEKVIAVEPGDAVLWLLYARARSGIGSFDDAVRACQKAVALRPDFFEAWTLLGHCLAELSNFKEAHAAYRHAAGLKPEDGEAWVGIGNCLYALGEYGKSITAYLKAAECKTVNEAIWHNIGLAYQVQGKFNEAIDAFRKAIVINPGVADSWYQQGRSHAELNQHAEAAECFAKAAEFNSGADDAWYRRGLSLSKLGAHDEAIASFVKAAEVNSTDADIWYQTGLSRVATGNIPEAINAFSRAIDIAPNRPELQYQLGLARESAGQNEEAIAAFQKAVELAPEKTEAWQRLGLCLSASSRYAEAIPALRKTLEFLPDNTVVLLPLAMAEHAMGNYDEAIACYRKAIKKYPDSEEALFSLALALHATNNYTEALPIYGAVVKKWPRKQEAWYNMGLAYHAVGEIKPAIAAYREAGRLKPESTEPWYQLGVLFYASEQYGEAIQAFRKVISRAPDMHEAWFNLGNSYLAWLEYSDAIESYTKATVLKADDYMAWAYLAAACYGANLYAKAVEAASKAFELKPEEPWIKSMLGLSKLFSGDAAGAAEILESLPSADPDRQETGRAITEIQKALEQNPVLPGAADILKTLMGG